MALGNNFLIVTLQNYPLIFSKGIRYKWKQTFYYDYVAHLNAHEHKNNEDYLRYIVVFLPALSCLQIYLDVVCWQ